MTQTKTDVGRRMLDVTTCDRNPSQRMRAKRMKPCCHVDPTSLERARVCNEKNSKNVTASTDLVDAHIIAVLTTKRNETFTTLGDFGKLLLESELMLHPIIKTDEAR